MQGTCSQLRFDARNSFVQAVSGGALSLAQSSVIVTNCSFVANTCVESRLRAAMLSPHTRSATAQGGAIFAISGSLSVLSSRFIRVRFCPG